MSVDMPPKKEESLEKGRVARLFGITDFIDKARWEGTDTESLINYAPVNLSDDDNAKALGSGLAISHFKKRRRGSSLKKLAIVWSLDHCIIW
jgi:hypothetical protein